MDIGKKKIYSNSMLSMILRNPWYWRCPINI